MAQWRHLFDSALEANSQLRHAKYFQLATVRPNGTPANRTVVFRGFFEGTDILKFTTDVRSQKIKEIQFCPNGEICYYFPETWEQFRIFGSLKLITSLDTDQSKLLARQRMWLESSHTSRLQFAGPFPGKAICQEDSSSQSFDVGDEPLDTFCVVTLEPEKVDYLNLHQKRRIIFQRLQCDGAECSAWNTEEVNP